MSNLTAPQRLQAAIAIANTGRSFRQLPDGSLVWLDGEPAPTDAALEAAFRRSLPQLTPRQLRLWLVSAGMTTAAVDAHIDQIPDDATRQRARIEWDFATQYRRDHPLVAQLGTALGLTAEQIDAAFVAAAAL